MNADKSRRAICVHLCSSVVLILSLCGCGTPNAANIKLRKENQDLREQFARLERERDADRARIKSLEPSAGTLATLPNDRLEKLFTTHGVRIEKLTGGSRSRPELPADDVLKVYVVPTDADTDELKAAGSFAIKAYDLNEPGSPLLGTWEFDTDQARKSWYGSAMLYEYVFACPLKPSPKHEQITVHVTFTDALTQRQFEAQKVIHVSLGGGATTRPDR
jgi:hypothetical protein